MHSRRVNIAEFEHRWMHERGACGCEVKFPAMQGPRVVQRTWTTGEATEISAGASTAGPVFPEQGIHSMGNNDRSGRNGQPTESGGPLLPLFQEKHVDGNLEVDVRLSSLYAAEWTKDHAKRHESGQCNCHVRFEIYKPYDIENDQGKTDGFPQQGCSQLMVHQRMRMVPCRTLLPTTCMAHSETTELPSAMLRVGR